MLVGGVILMGLVHLPRLGHVLRWPGLTLLLTGVAFFIGFTIMKTAVPNRVEAAYSPLSTSRLANDMFRSLVHQIASGFTVPALALIVVGATLLAGSFFVRYSFRRVSSPPS